MRDIFLLLMCVTPTLALAHDALQAGFTPVLVVRTSTAAKCRTQP